MTECLATFWRQKTDGVAHWRCALPAKYLPGRVIKLDPGLDMREHHTFPERVVFPRQRGAAIWQFPGDAVRGLMMAQLQENGVRVLVEVDDNYLIRAQKTPGASERSEWHRTITAARGHTSNEAHRRICSFADGIICATPLLGKQYAKVNESVYVCPNQVDPGEWPDPEKADDGILRIGYAGSPSHRRDTPLLTRALEWAAKQDGVQVVFVGFHPTRARFKYELVDWADSLETYRRNMSILDVGLCPLVETPWAACRSDVKALEYSMAGALSVVSRSEPYRPWWEKEMPCLVATTPKQFLVAVQWCVANRDEVKRIAAAAKAHVLAERTIEQNVWRWQEAIAER